MSKAKENAKRLTEERKSKVGDILQVFGTTYRVMGITGPLCQADRSLESFCQNLWLKKVNGRKEIIVTEYQVPYNQFGLAWDGKVAQDIIRAEWEI